MQKINSLPKIVCMWLLTFSLVVPSSSQAFTWSGLLSDLYNRYTSQSTATKIVIPAAIAAIIGGSWWFSNYLARQAAEQNRLRLLRLQELQHRGQQVFSQSRRREQVKEEALQRFLIERQQRNQAEEKQREQQRIQTMMQNVNVDESERLQSDRISKQKNPTAEQEDWKQTRSKRMQEKKAKKESEKIEGEKPEIPAEKSTLTSDQFKLAREESIKRKLNMTNILNSINEINKELSPETITTQEELLKEPFNRILTYSKQTHNIDLTNAIEHWLNPHILARDANDPEAVRFRPSDTEINQIKYLNTKRVIYQIWDNLTQNGQLKALREHEINDVIFPQLLAIEDLKPNISKDQQISIPMQNAEIARITTIKNKLKLVQQFVNNNSKAVNDKTSRYSLSDALGRYLLHPSLLLSPPNAQELTNSLKMIYTSP